MIRTRPPFVSAALMFLVLMLPPTASGATSPRSPEEGRELTRRAALRAALRERLLDVDLAVDEREESRHEAEDRFAGEVMRGFNDLVDGTGGLQTLSEEEFTSLEEELRSLPVTDGAFVGNDTAQDVLGRASQRLTERRGVLPELDARAERKGRERLANLAEHVGDFVPFLEDFASGAEVPRSTPESSPAARRVRRALEDRLASLREGPDGAEVDRRLGLMTAREHGELIAAVFEAAAGAADAGRPGLEDRVIEAVDSQVADLLMIDVRPEGAEMASIPTVDPRDGLTGPRGAETKGTDASLLPVAPPETATPEEGERPSSRIAPEVAARAAAREAAEAARTSEENPGGRPRRIVLEPASAFPLPEPNSSPEWIAELVYEAAAANADEDFRLRPSTGAEASRFYLDHTGWQVAARHATIGDPTYGEVTVILYTHELSEGVRRARVGRYPVGVVTAMDLVPEGEMRGRLDTLSANLSWLRGLDGWRSHAADTSPRAGSPEAVVLEESAPEPPPSPEPDGERSRPFGQLLF